MLLRFSIVKKLVFAFLALSLLPLSILGASTLQGLRDIGQRAIDSSTAHLEQRAREALEVRAVELAGRVSQFLRACEIDLFMLKMLPREPAFYRQFSLIHSRTIWTRTGTNESPVEVHQDIPLYREAAFIGADGRERVRVEEDRIVDAAHLRDVSQPEATTYKSERYFEETRKLKEGDVYVSHVTGWYVTMREQLRGADRIEDAVEGKKYEGVVRFATPCFDKYGDFEGMVVLSLDHRHLMELTLHIQPTEERFVVFPSYSSGNYAFMFDDDGWIISHPKFYDIRGLLPDGSELDATSPSYTREKLIAGEAPFHLDAASFINPNYPVMAREVRAGRSGVTSTFNVGGTPRVMAYAPIFYNRYPYDRYGVFGGITIGVQTEKFKEPALLATAKIDEMVFQTRRNSLVLLAGTFLSAVLLAIFLSRTFTRPIHYLAVKAQEIAGGHIPDEVAVHTGDELEVLARNFADMAREVREHQQSLELSLAERSALYANLVEERNFIRTILNQMTSGVITLSESGRLTWFNPYSENVFSIRGTDAIEKHYRDVFSAFPSWVEVIDSYLASWGEERQRTIEHYSVRGDGREMILEVHFSTIGQEKQQRRIHLLFLRDVTRRKRMEEHIRRSDRLVSLGVLAAGVAHEMRNPLTGISLLMDDFHDRLQDRPQERELIEKSLHEIDRLENLIHGLLDFAAPSRRVTLEVRPLGEVLDKTLFLVRKLCKNQNIDLELHVQALLPLLNQDPEKLQQAILNLLLNAIQAMPEGGSLHIEVKTVPLAESLLDEPALRISVSDSGKGIAAEDIPFIFDPFFSRTPSGCGLGLAIVHGIVEEHHGRISVSSRQGSGTVIWLDLPVWNDKPAQA